MNQISQISSDLSAAVALDLASNMWTESEVLARHGIDPVHGAKLLQQDWFKKMVAEAKSEWASIKNAKERIRLKSQVAVEQAIVDLFTIITDKQIPASARVAAFKELKEVAGVVVQQDSGPAGNVPSVNIFLNGDPNEPSFSVSAPKVVREAPEIELTAEDLAVTPSNPDDDFIGVAPLGG